jgi:chorismate mutase
MTKSFRMIVFLLALLAPALARADTGVTALLALMNERLAVQSSVAQYKWNAKQPIEDREREAALLASVAKLAPDHGLPPDFAQAFFRAQIEAGKAIQRALFQRWESAGQGRFADAPDLASVIRPALDRLTPALLSALAASMPDLPEPAIQSRIREVPEIWRDAPGAWSAAIQPLSR